MAGTPEEQSAVTARVGFTEVRLKLSRLKPGGGLRELYRQIAELAAEAMDVDRVGVWFFEPENDLLRCAWLHDRRVRHVIDLSPLQVSRVPVYASAIREHRFIATDDAQNDPQTRELAQSYLVPNGITSMLDSAIYRDGQVIGVVCLEHVGPRRGWLPEEHQFAATVADLLAYFVEAESRVEVERQAHQLELRAKDQQRLEAIARFAAGVGHDLNNLLAVVTNGLELLDKRLDVDGKQISQMIRTSAEQSSALVKQLVLLGRREPPQAQLLEARHLKGHLAQLLAATVQPPWEVAFDVDDRVTFYADATQLEQVVLNLVHNARDATKGGGTVLVRLHPAPRRAGPAFSQIQVVDTGQGMSDQELDRLGEPFFTTKPRGKGTGLGMATVLLLVNLHGGQVSIDSTPGEGTTVTVRWPADAEAMEALAAQAPTHERPGLTEAHGRQ
ncbi:MAG: GAF domain-containing sensor histidine kinase [Myxococcaceae bacterium]|nr:GAF domain-containing sensor histidine kinase [Myxococcaceae bacterium]